MSRSGSRYPSAFGHTPSYRSYVKGGLDTGLASDYGTTGLGLGSTTLSPSLGSAGVGGSFDLSMPSFSKDLGLSGGSGNYASSTSKVSSQNYSSVSDSRRDGGRPVVEYSSDATFRKQESGPSGIPRTQYATSSQAYSSEDPYKNRNFNYSYNI